MEEGCEDGKCYVTESGAGDWIVVITEKLVI
jgi:hypothetical protein